MSDPPRELQQEWARDLKQRYSQLTNDTSKESFRNGICELLLTGFNSSDSREINSANPLEVKTKILANYIENFEMDDPDSSQLWRNRMIIDHIKHKGMNETSDIKSPFEYFRATSNIPGWLEGLRTQHLPPDWKIDTESTNTDQSDIADAEAADPLARKPILHVSLRGAQRALESENSPTQRSTMSQRITDEFRSAILSSSRGIDSEDREMKTKRNSFNNFCVLHIVSTHALIALHGRRNKTKQQVKDAADFFSYYLSKQIGSSDLEVRVSDARESTTDLSELFSLESNSSVSDSLDPARSLFQEIEDLGNAWALTDTFPIEDNTHYLLYIDGLQLAKQCWRGGEGTWRGFVRSSIITPIMDSAMGKISAAISQLQPRPIQKGGDEIAVIVKGNSCAWVDKSLRQNHVEFREHMRLFSWPRDESIIDSLDSYYNPFWWWSVIEIPESPDESLEESAGKLLKKDSVECSKKRRRDNLPKFHRTALRIELHESCPDCLNET